MALSTIQSPSSRCSLLFKSDIHLLSPPPQTPPPISSSRRHHVTFPPLTLQSRASRSLPQPQCAAATSAETIPSKVGKRIDIKKIMILGAGPIVIGQACEFDYSGTQACKALKEEGYEVILINSNPATIMTDPDLADRTYISPLTPEVVERIIEKEKPDALLPTMGGQTALNLAVALAENGVLEKYNVELIGAKLEAIKKAEDRELFKDAMKKIGLKTPPSGIGTTLDECFAIAAEIGEFPLIIRPAFTLGGTGGGIAYNKEEFESICKSGLNASLTSQVLVEKSLLGWKEYELEVMRDLADNVVIICSIENIDAMGVHTGDSITVAPAQTLTDKEYQRLRDYSIRIIREIGVECGGSNVQFAVNPVDGEVMIIEMNPRVSRSSALASKATGFPIAKMAAKLSVGYSLDQIPNDITKKTPASFEPSIDYVVTKIPRFAFEKFPGSQPILTTQMKSVGEDMSMGRTFQESFQKAVRGLECGYPGWGCSKVKELEWDWDQLKYSLRVPNPNRIHSIYAAMKKGMQVDEIHQLSFIDKWFLTQLKELVDVEQYLMSKKSLSDLMKDDLYEVKKRGFSDKQIAFATKSTEKEVRRLRLSFGIAPAYKRVDTCAAEFEADTPYMYSSYDSECEAAPTSKKKVLILGGGPNRIGQGIEFDYCCCHTSFALQDAGYETIMMNSNPETVSTDYDTSDRLYFEPLTIEDVLNVIDLERPDGIIVQFGGQTPLKLALPIQQYLDENKPMAASGAGHVRIWGTSPDNIDAAEDRERFNAILKELEIEQPKGGIAKSEADAFAIAAEIGYPVVVRPSYVLGGRAMEIVYSDEKLGTYLETAVEVDPERPVLIDKYLSDAVEIDIDALADLYGNVVIGGIMEHIEQAGVHSGDSACILPTQTVSTSCLAKIRTWTEKLAKRLRVCGLMNCQYAITAAGEVFLLEANPRASRTVPFVSKTIGHPLAKYAALVMSGKSLDEDLGFTKEVIPSHVAVKEAVLPFEKFAGCDVVLGPEMRSTGEVMGIDFRVAVAFAKAQLAAGQKLPLSGTVFLSLNDLTKEPHLERLAKAFLQLGFKIVATSGSARFLELKGIPVERVLKMHEGRPHAGDMQLSRTTAKKKGGAAAAAAFRGLGCTAGAAKQVSVPAMIRSSAEWERKKVKVKKKKMDKKSKEVVVAAAGGGENGDGGLNQGGNCMVVQDVWCGPGIGFSPDAVVVDSVDCVVNRRNRIDTVEKFNLRERERERERERPCLSRRAAVDPQAFAFWDADPTAFATLRPEQDMSGGSRYYRHLRRAPPDGLAEMLMLQNGIVMGGRLDRFNEWRLDIDSMSYEQLLDLEDRIGYVSTGLKEDEIGHCIRKYKLSVLSKLPSHIQMSLDKKCSICQEDFEGGDAEVGKLECGHGFHIHCIKQWLAHKNNCPVCKTAPLPRT